MQLIIRMPNWVGDAIMTLPALYALQSIGFQLDLYGKPWLPDLLSAIKNINIHVMPEHFWQSICQISILPQFFLEVGRLFLLRGKVLISDRFR